MKAMEMPAYAKLQEKFTSGEYKLGRVYDVPIYTYSEGCTNLTVGHYIDAMDYCRIPFAEVPKKYLTREFFLHTLSGCKEEIVEYVKAHMGEMFDREFFKDLIATEKYALYFKNNCFSYMPLEYIDEEMVYCAMMKAIGSRYIDRRGDNSEWFYSVVKRKPEVLNETLYTLAARYFARNEDFLDVTPREYKTRDYYFALCVKSNKDVMSYFPEEIVTTEFLIDLINDDPKNVISFSDAALEKTARFVGQNKDVKFWQAVMLLDGYAAQYIPLNEERIKFFFDHYDKSSGEYRFGFKTPYRAYIKKKKVETSVPTVSKDIERAVVTAYVGMFGGDDIDIVIDNASSVARASTNRKAALPITYRGVIPEEYEKKYDHEEYVAEIYKKLGITILSERDSHYYNVILPDNLSIQGDGGTYFLMDGTNKLLSYLDVGPFYDRSVYIQEINVTL